MNILYCGDQKMQDGLLISILSLLKHVQEPLNIFILTATIKTNTKTYLPISDQTIDFFNAIMRRTNSINQITKIDISNLVELNPPTANMATSFTPNCMLRLYSDQLPALPDKILYLDTDVIYRENPESYYHQNMAHYELAGTLDYYGRWLFHRDWEHFDYINSGILLLNLSEIRKTHLFQRSLALCAQKTMFMPDQSALNNFVAAAKIMPRRYNEQRQLKPDTMFQHFTTSFRLFPWIHTLTVKPWEIKQMHAKLKLYEYDDILRSYETLSREMREGYYDETDKYTNIFCNQ